jgi:hypothetical protein
MDATDPHNIIHLKTWADRFSSAHNVVLDKTCTYLYLTHEIAYGPISVWKFPTNASGEPLYTSWDPLNIGVLSIDLFAGSMPHNVWVKGDELWAAYYRQGTAVWDISNPARPVQMGVFKNIDAPVVTDIWGTFPYTDTGLAYSSDINNGLQVLQLTAVSPSQGPTCTGLTHSGIGLLVMWLITLACLVVSLVYIFMQRRKRSTEYAVL